MTTGLSMFKVTPVPIIEDNYVWIIEHNDTCIVVDPGDAKPVIAHLKQNDLIPDAVIITHKHWDHVTGIPELKSAFPTAKLHGPVHEKIVQRDVDVKDGDVLDLAGLQWQVKHLPGHTLDLVAYYVTDESGQGHVFSGDCLFACGCGYMFEGNPEQFQSSLDWLMNLPHNTIIYPTHEYTLANINFALHVEPNNLQLIARQEDCQELRSEGIPTVPTTVAKERATNPFVRWDQPDIVRAVCHHTGEVLAKPPEVFAALRQWKNEFRG